MGSWYCSLTQINLNSCEALSSHSEAWTLVHTTNTLSFPPPPSSFVKLNLKTLLPESPTEPLVGGNN